MSWKASAYMKKIVTCPNGERITRNEKLVGLVLADSHQDHGKSHTFPSVEGIAEDSLMSERECRRVLASMERKGVIQRVKPAVQYRGLTTFYLFVELDVEGCQPVPLKGGQKGGQKGDRELPKNSAYMEELLTGTIEHQEHACEDQFTAKAILDDHGLVGTWVLRDVAEAVCNLRIKQQLVGDSARAAFGKRWQDYKAAGGKCEVKGWIANGGYLGNGTNGSEPPKKSRYRDAKDVLKEMGIA